MSDKPHSILRIAEITRPGGWAPLRKELDVQSFGVNAWTAAEIGGQLIEPHDEARSGHEELYIVIAGRATFTVGGDELDAPAGAVLFIPDPNEHRVAIAAEAGTTVLAVGGKPGAVYTPLAWEANFETGPLFAAGRFAEVKQLVLSALDRYPDRAVLLFNLACAEARLGETAAALGHLHEAILEQPDLADDAKTDADFDSLRGSPAFDELVGVT